MDYYIIRDNKRQGPFSIEYLKEMGISAETKVWHEGLAAWTRAREIPELVGRAQRHGVVTHRKPRARYPYTK